MRSVNCKFNFLKDHYIDSTILTAIEEATLKIRVFGT
jgi:hypothetical protein